jgi:cellulose 1,4-beta-cellobiosidase
VFLSPFYTSEVQTAANAISDPTQKAKALSVVNIPTFIWLDVVAKVPTLGDQLANASALAAASGRKYLVQIVVYDLPDRDCAAAASNGEFSIAAGGLTKYMNYIHQIVAQITSGLSDGFYVYLINVTFHRQSFPMSESSLSLSQIR